jgi:hypothetical protein
MPENICIIELTVGADLCVCPELDETVGLGEHTGSPLRVFVVNKKIFFPTFCIAWRRLLLVFVE